MIRDFQDADAEHVRYAAWDQNHNVLAYVPHRHAEGNWEVARVLDTSSGTEIGHIDVGEKMTGLDFSPDGTMICVGTQTGRVRIYKLVYTPDESDRKTLGTETFTFALHTGPVNRVRFLDNDRVISVGADGQVGLFFCRPSKPLRPRFPERNQSTTSRLSASPDNQLLAESQFDGTVRIIDHATGRILVESAPLSGAAIELDWSGDGTHLVAICAAGDFCCWRVDESSLVECLRGTVKDFYQTTHAGLVLSQDGSTLYIGGYLGPDGFSVWDTRAVEQTTFVSTLYDVHRMLVSPDDRQLIAAHEGVCVFERPTHTLRHHLRQGGVCQSLMYAPDGRTLVVGYDDGSIRLWDTEEGRLLRTLTEYERQNCRTLSPMFSPDHRTLIAGDSIGRLRFWNTSNWGHIGALRVFSIGHPRDVTYLALTPDGQTVEIGRSLRPRDQHTPSVKLYTSPLHAGR